MQLAEKYLDKFYTNNSVKRPLNKFLDFIKRQSFVDFNYRHAHPLVLLWDITSACNLRCKHCYYSEDKNNYDSSSDLSTGEVLTVIDGINNINIPHVVISGGEPFIRNDMFEILKKFKSKNISVYLQTNGTLLDENNIQKLSNILIPEVDCVQVSLDGLKETHEKSRGTNTFDKAIKSIREMVKYKIPVYVNCTATSFNLDEIIPLYKFISELGVTKFSLSKLKPSNDTHNNLIPDFDKLLQLSCDLIDIENEKTFLELGTFTETDFINKNLATDYLLQKSKNIILDADVHTISCHRHGNLLIAANGNVFSCANAYLYEELKMGNIKDTSLEEIWNARFSNVLFQDRAINKMSCKNCNYFGVCLGGCPLYAYIHHHDINAVGQKCSMGEGLLCGS